MGSKGNLRGKCVRMMMGRSRERQKKRTFLADCTPHSGRNSSLPSANSQLIAWCRSFKLSVHRQIYLSIKWDKVHTFSKVGNFLPPHVLEQHTNLTILLHTFSFSTKDQTQKVMHTRKELYHWATPFTPQPKFTLHTTMLPIAKLFCTENLYNTIMFVMQILLFYL